MTQIKIVPVVVEETRDEIDRLMRQLRTGPHSSGTRVKLRRLIHSCIYEAYKLGKGVPPEEEQRVESKIQPIFDSEADKMRYGQLYHTVKNLARIIDEPVESTECRLAQYLKSRGVCSL